MVEKLQSSETIIDSVCKIPGGAKCSTEKRMKRE